MLDPKPLSYRCSQLQIPDLSANGFSRLQSRHTACIKMASPKTHHRSPSNIVDASVSSRFEPLVHMAWPHSEKRLRLRNLQPVCVPGLPSWSRGPFGSVVVVGLRRRRRALRLVGQLAHFVRVPPSAGPATRVSLRSVEPPPPPSRLCARSGCPWLAAAGRRRRRRRGAVGRSPGFCGHVSAP